VIGKSSFQSCARQVLAWNRTLFYSAPESGTRRIRCQICMTHVPETGSGKMASGVNRKLPARSTTVQLLSICADLERHNAERYGRTDRQTYDAKSWSNCVQ